MACCAAPASSDPEPGAHDPPPEAIVGEIPFLDRGSGGHIYLDLAPEGYRPMVFILDTGAQGSVVSPRTARAMGITVRRNRDRPYQRKTRLGRDVHIWVDTRRSDTAASGGWEYGVLGGPFLANFVVEVDYAQRIVRFLHPKRFRVPKETNEPGEAVIPLQIVSNRIFSEIAYRGERMRVLIDTGAPDAVLLSGVGARKLGIDPDALPRVGSARFIVGATELRLFESPDFRFGDLVFPWMPVFIAPRGTFNLGGNTDSLVGNDLLRPFLVRIDYPRERLWLKRRPDHGMTHFGVDYELTRPTGALLALRGSSYHVFGVLPGSPAERMGLRQGDQIIGDDAGEEDPPDLADTVRRILEGDELAISRREGDLWVDTVLGESGVQAGTGTPPEPVPISSQ